MTDELWGPWTRHDGKGCPLPIGTLVQAVVQDPFGEYVLTNEQCVGDPIIALTWSWENYRRRVQGGPGKVHILSRVIRYRIRRYRAASELIAACAEVGEDA